MDMVKETVQTEQLAGVCQSQAVVEGEITLPGGLREAAHVLHAGGMAVAEKAEALQDRVTITGRVVFHVLYTQGDPTKVNAVEATADFTHLCDLPGAQGKASILADVQVEHVEAKVQNGNLAMRAVLNITARAMLSAPLELVSGVTGAEGVETQSHQVTLRRTVSTGSNDALLREEFALPEGLQVRDTLYATAYPQVTEVSGGLGRVGVSGQIALEVVHASDMPGKPVVITRHSLPFEQSVELKGENGDLLDARVVVKDVAAASQDAGDGERTLRVEVLLGVTGWADKQEDLTVLSDAYTTMGDDLLLTTKELTVRTEQVRTQTAESGKLTLMLPDGAPPVRSILCAFISPVVTERTQTAGHLTVEGMLEITLLYMTDTTSSPVTVSQEEPFRLTFAADAAAEDLLCLQTAEVEAIPITSDRVEIKYIMRLTADGVRCEPLQVVADAQTVDAAPGAEGIILYFAQPGETLWEIAKRYRMSGAQVRAMNPELTGEPYAGQGLIVWKREA